MIKKIFITGYTSKIILEFIKLLNFNNHNIEVVKCGRHKNSDIFVDFSNIQSTKKFISKIIKYKPQYLFLNHGYIAGKKLNDMTSLEIKKTINVNFLSVLMVVEKLHLNSNLQTLVTSSISGKVGSFDTLYAATKAGIDLICRAKVKELDKKSRINIISPGMVYDAKMTSSRKDIKNINKKRLLTPSKQHTSSKEIAELAIYILLNSKNLNGQNININGGLY